MDEKQRVAGFMRELAALEQRWGVTVVVQQATQTLVADSGERVTQVVARAVPALIQSWQPGENDERDTDTDRGDGG